MDKLPEYTEDTVDILVRVRDQNGDDQEFLFPKSYWCIFADLFADPIEYDYEVNIRIHTRADEETGKHLHILDRTVIDDETAQNYRNSIGMNEFNPPENQKPDVWNMDLCNSYVPRQKGIHAYHATKDNLAEVAERLLGVVDYSDLGAPVIKFKASSVSTRKDRRLYPEETTYRDPETGRWEVMRTWEFKRLFRLASENEVL